MNELSQFLEQQREAGAVESVGSFTVAIEKARDKMGAQSLVSTEDYLLKLVQCATAAKTQELRISLKRRVVMVYFETEVEDLTLSVDKVSRSLTAPLEERDPARSHLAMAVCALVHQDPVELMWGEWDNQSGGTILSFGDGRSEVFREVPFPRDEPLADDRRFFLLYFVKQPTSIPFGQTSREHKAVKARCSFAPMPIYLDGKLLGPSLPLFFSESDPAAPLTAPYVGSLLIESGDEAPLRWHGQPHKPRSDLPHQLTSFAAGMPPIFRSSLPINFPVPVAETVNFSALYAIPVYLFGASHIHYVKDGVLLYPVRVHDSGGGALAVLPGDHLKTDLTGFQVIENESIEVDKVHSSATWKQMIVEMTEQPLPTLANKSQVVREGGVASAFGCCLFPPLGLLVGPLYAWFMTRGGGQRLNTNQKLQRKLEDRRNYLSYFKKPKDPREKSRPDPSPSEPTGDPPGP